MSFSYAQRRAMTLADLDAAASPTKSEVFTTLGPEAREIANAFRDLEAENARLREALNFFVNDDRFIVQVGGNPRAIDAMLEKVKDALNTGDNQ